MALQNALRGVPNSPMLLDFKVSADPGQYFSLQQALSTAVLLNQNFTYLDEAVVLYTGLDDSKIDLNLTLSSGGCLSDGVENCTAVCEGPTLFHDMTTLHNCAYFSRLQMLASLLSIDITTTPETTEVAGSFGLLTNANQLITQSLNVPNSAIMFIHACLADYCNWKYNQPDCSAVEGMQVFGPLFPTGNKSLEHLNMYDICKDVDGTLVPEVGGIGVGKPCDSVTEGVMLN
jgi:hypothetical protein